MPGHYGGGKGCQPRKAEDNVRKVVLANSYQLLLKR